MFKSYGNHRELRENTSNGNIASSNSSTNSSTNASTVTSNTSVSQSSIASSKPLNRDNATEKFAIPAAKPGHPISIGTCSYNITIEIEIVDPEANNHTNLIPTAQIMYTTPADQLYRAPFGPPYPLAITCNETEEQDPLNLALQLSHDIYDRDSDLVNQKASHPSSGFLTDEGESTSVLLSFLNTYAWRDVERTQVTRWLYERERERMPFSEWALGL